VSQTSPFVRVEFDRAELKQAIARDCITALTFYLGEELTLEVPAFHEEIWGELVRYLDRVSEPEFLVGHLQKLFAVPREHSKSTLAKVAVIIFMRYSPLSFTLYISRTSGIALNAIKDVVAFMKSENEVELYGQPTVIKANETDSLYIVSIWRADGTRKTVILKAVGAQHQVRGLLIENKRPDFVVFDDVEDYETADGGVQQKKLDEWVMGTVMKATARRSFRLMLGNMVRNTTLLARLSKDADWNPTVFGALVRDKVTGALQALWEGRWTVESLMEDYRKYRKLGLGHIWETEMMNLSKDVLFTADLSAMPMLEYVSPDDVEAGFLCLDPAFGQNAWNDESAITVHVRVKDYPIPVIVAHRVGRFTENQILDNMVELSYYWNLTSWAVESQAAQRLLIPLFRLLLLDRKVNPDVFLMLPVFTGQNTKSSRIIAFRTSCGAGSYAMTEDQVDIRLKLEDYSPDTKDHDDLCDSAAFGPIVWSAFGESIQSQGRADIAGALLQQDSNLFGRRTVGELDACAH
jgi:hypothetical protein